MKLYVQVDKTRPDIMVVDISMPGNSGIDLIRELKARHLGIAGTRVFHARRNACTRSRSSARVPGATWMKQEPPERLIEGLRTVLKGELFVSQRMSSTMLNAFVGAFAPCGGRSSMESLSVRELQVFEGIGGGLSTQQPGR